MLPTQQQSIKILKAKTELQEEIDECIISGNFHTTLSAMERHSRQEVNKYTVELNSTINLLDIITSTDYFIQQQATLFFFKLTWNM